MTNAGPEPDWREQGLRYEVPAHRREAGRDLSTSVGGSFELRVVTAEQTADLRRQVLRGGRDVPLPGDETPAFHVGVFSDDQLIATGNIRAEAARWQPHRIGWRIRGMATWREVRGQGAGAMVLEALLDHARELGGGTVWCNARLKARKFYERAGFVVRGEPWEEPDIGPHVVMWRDL